MAHVHRKFYDIQVANGSPIAAEAIQRIGALYDIELEIRGTPPELRRQARQRLATVFLLYRIATTAFV